MTQFNFIKSLIEEAEDKALLEGVSVDALTRSSFFKAVKIKKPELAEALEGFWGHVDFDIFAQAAIDSVKLKKGKWKNIDEVTVENLGKLIQLHDKLFPTIAKKVETTPNAYKREVTSAAAAGRHAERDWLANMD